MNRPPETRHYPNIPICFASMMLDFQWKTRNSNPERRPLSAADEAFCRVNDASERCWFELCSPEDRDLMRRMNLTAYSTI